MKWPYLLLMKVINKTGQEFVIFTTLLLNVVTTYGVGLFLQD